MPADGTSLAGQDQKRSLKDVLRILLVTYHAPGDGQDHGPVPLHENGERDLLPPGDEPLDKLGIGQIPACTGIQQPVQMPQDACKGASHGQLPWRVSECYQIVPRPG